MNTKMTIALCSVLIGMAATTHALPLDVAGKQVQKKEVRHSMIGYRSTLLFYTFSEQKAVLRLQIGNTDNTFPVTAKIYSFDQAVTADGLKKWLNNQHSDALFGDAPRPASTHELPANVCAVTSHKLIDQSKQRNGTFDNYLVTLTVKNYKGNGLALTGFSVDTKVHVKAK